MPRRPFRSVPTVLSIPAGDLRRALLGAWLVLSVALGLGLAAALALPAGQVLALAARCEIPGGHREPCAACGMTRAFLAWKAGDLRTAAQANAAGPVLFPLLGLNEAAAAGVLIFRRKHSRPWRNFARSAG